jgi:hypothetical protein
MSKFRAVLVFGDFRLYNFELEDDRAFKPIYLLHPTGIINLSEPITEAQMVQAPSIKKMTFEYYQQLDRDLLEYRFAGEQ